MTEALRFPWADERPASTGDQGTARTSSRRDRPAGSPTAGTTSRGEPRHATRPSPGAVRKDRRVAQATRVATPGQPGTGGHPAPSASIAAGQPSISAAAAVPTALAPRRVRPPRVRLGSARDPVPEAPVGRVVQGPERERHEPDYLVLVATAGLAAVGMLMIVSSKGVEGAMKHQGNVFGEVGLQVLGLGFGMLALFLFMRLDYRVLRLASVPFYAVALALLAVVLVPGGIGPFEPTVIGGSARWLRIGSLPTFHPAELAKLALVIYLAHWLARRGLEVRSPRHGTLPFLVIAGLAIGLVAIEPDLGTTVVISLAAFTMFFVAGGRVLHLALIVPLGLAGVAVYLRGYQMERIQTWQDPWSVAAAEGYQTVQGLLSLAAGGVVGTGLGQSSQPGGVDVPNAHNDYIFALVGQELGLLGSLAVVGLFLLLAYRGVRVAMAAPDTFGALLAFGITAWLAFQGFINVGVVTTLLPATGIPMPFVSAGATSLVVSFAAVGILLSISRETVQAGSATQGGSSTHADPGRGGGHGRPHLPRPRRAAGAV